jgi:bacillopeptidase F
MERGGGIGTPPGIINVGARRVWNELGITGVGALVANMDTGVDGVHPALSSRWRGNFAPASECWRDAVGFGDPTPEDHNGHGTHTMGTICGQAPNDSIGICPGALWIADNTINQGVGSAFDNDVITGLQWLSDPDGNPNTLQDVPDVVQHSWGINESFPGGYVDCDSRWWVAIDNIEAAGVAQTWSAGNEGPGPVTLRSPADRATSPYNVFSVGATIHSPPVHDRELLQPRSLRLRRSVRHQARNLPHLA